MKKDIEDMNLGTVDIDIAGILDRKNIEKWLESIPEVARRNESTEILVLVYLVEMLSRDQFIRAGSMAITFFAYLASS